MPAHEKARLKVCLAASAGGHLNQLLSSEDAWKEEDFFFVTTGEMVADRLSKRYNTQVHVLGESNREHPLKVFRVLLGCVRMLLKERPDVIISTGAAHGCLLCVLGRLTGAKVVWLDSIANVERLSLSGRIVRYFAHLFLVQWPELVARYPDVEYHGELV